jgi:AcrR family transcriptional regulator
MSTTEPRGPVRERVLQTADRLFYAEGIHAVGIDRIVSEAQVAKASLYGHFRGKDALVRAYLDRRSVEWREHVEAELPHRAADPLERLLAVFDLLGEWFMAPGYRGCPFINAAAEYDISGPVGAVLTGHRAWLRNLFTTLLHEAGRPGANAVIEQLCLLYDGAMVAARLDATPDAAAHARAAAQTLLGAARPASE